MLAGALDPLADDAADGFVEHQLHVGGLFGAGFGESHLNISKYTPLLLANF